MKFVLWSSYNLEMHIQFSSILGFSRSLSIGLLMEFHCGWGQSLYKFYSLAFSSYVSGPTLWFVLVNTPCELENKVQSASVGWINQLTDGGIGLSPTSGRDLLEKSVEVSHYDSGSMCFLIVISVLLHRVGSSIISIYTFRILGSSWSF